MSENTNNVIQFPRREADSVPVEGKKHFWDRFTRRQKAVAVVGSLLAASTVIAATGPEAKPNNDQKLLPIPKLAGNIDSIGTFQGTEDWDSVVKVKVESGDSVSSIQLKVYGADDSEQPMNNEFYNDEIAIIQSAQPDPEMLHPGDVLVLPADVTQHYAIPEEESN